MEGCLLAPRDLAPDGLPALRLRLERDRLEAEWQTRSLEAVASVRRRRGRALVKPKGVSETLFGETPEGLGVPLCLL